MSIDQIQKFLDGNKQQRNEYVKITFKMREPLFGLFVKGNTDFNELKAKNFWRIIPGKSLDEYNSSRNLTLSRIFSGSQFMTITPYSEMF